MRRIFRWIGPLALAMLLLPPGCRQDANPGVAPSSTPVVRVLLLENQPKVTVGASTPAVVRVAKDSTARRMAASSRDSGVEVTPTAGGWQVGSTTFSAGELLIAPEGGGAVYVNGSAYRGRLRLVHKGGGKIDVVNDVDVDGYLKGVLPDELLKWWDPKAYEAQAVVARTYVLYESKIEGAGRHFDVYPDQRSQVYGGLDVETPKSRAAVDATVGQVVTFGPPGQEKIFKAYFSACCGGISQNDTDAFGDPFIEPLTDQNVGNLCSAAPRFNWGPIVVKKDELTRRIKLFGARSGRPEKDIAAVTRIDIAAANRFGRPVRYVITDSRGNRYSISGEDIRRAVNTDAPEGSRLFSSFFKPVNDADAIRFSEGHGHGHGVGMCQWCTQTRAAQGMPWEKIVLLAYPQSKIRTAY